MSRRLPFVLLGAVALTIFWGALAFGAVYPWAYTPLAVAAGVSGAAALIVERKGRPPLMALAAGLLITGGAIGLQLVPISPTALARVSPGTLSFLGQYDLGYAVNPVTHPVSIQPEKTLLGLGLFASFALLLLGTSRLVSATGARAVVRTIVGFGVVLAFIGIVEQTITANDVHPLIYGFWKPKSEGHPFGPFVNPNHFAGWMLMALPLALGGFYDALLRLIATGPRSRRDPMAIMASPHFGSMMSYAMCCLVMGLSLMMTRSRSAVAAFAVGSALAAWIVFRHMENTRTRVLVSAAFLALFAGTAIWAGSDTLFSKFIDARTDLATVSGRLDAWKDTVAIVKRFPLAGTGFDTYGTAMILYQTGVRSGPRAVHFQEAHNDYLQLAAEGGILVGLPVCATLVVFVRQIRRRFREAPGDGTTYWLRVGAVIGLVGIAIQSLVEFSLQMPGNAALFAVVAAIALHQSPNLRRMHPHAMA